MRVSVDENDPGHANFLKCRRWYVWFNGEPIQWVRTADEEEGMIVREVRRDGKLVPTPKGDEVLTETIYGEVRVQARFPDNLAA